MDILNTTINNKSLITIVGSVSSVGRACGEPQDVGLTPTNAICLFFFINTSFLIHGKPPEEWLHLMGLPQAVFIQGDSL